jgi:hypothetical protein
MRAGLARAHRAALLARREVKQVVASGRFVVCTDDHFFPANFMRTVVADRLAIKPDEIAAGHCVALSRPTELATLLASYAVGDA